MSFDKFQHAYIILLPIIEPYNFFGRRGQKEPQVFAAASKKRLYIENIPYLVTGCRHQVRFDGPQSITSQALSNLKFNHLDTPCNISSMGEKYQYMKITCKKRLAFGEYSFQFFFEGFITDCIL